MGLDAKGYDMGKWQEAAVLVTLTMGLLAHAGEREQQALLNQSAEQLLGKAREAYTILDRANLSKALAAKGVSALPQLGGALGDKHWHVRHCALMAMNELARNAENRTAMKSLLPDLGRLVVQDPHHGVRVEAAECLGALGEKGQGAQEALAKAALQDKDNWVRATAATALAAVKADVAVMLPVYGAMIRSTDKAARAAGVREAARLFDQKVDITSLIPALKEVFSNCIYDANFSHQTREPAINLLIRLKVDTRDLVPFIMKDLAITGNVQADGYHPYQRITLKLLGRMGANAAAAIAMLEQVIADPSKFGCAPSHPDYPGFKADARESIEKIRADLKSKGTK
jgi:HEAT repeat protein